MIYAVLFFLLIMSYFDIRSREIPLMPLIAFGTIMLISCIYEIIQGREILELICCLSPGIVLIVFHITAPKHTGLGDGLILLLTELSMPLYYCMEALFITAIATLLFGLGLLILNRKSQIIPFVPFIFIGYLGTFLRGLLFE